MIYCDTSVLVAALADEPGTVRAQAWIAAQTGGTLCASGWVVAEFSSAVALKVRRGTIPIEDAAVRLSNWRILQRDYLTMVPIDDDAFRLAATFCDRYELGLKSPDALHLAVASLGGHTIATFDAAMASAALAVGVETVAV